jgi:uncharacterized phage infection (PIP) family protein YhgE
MTTQGPEVQPQVETQVNTEQPTVNQPKEAVTYTQDQVSKMQSTFETKANVAEQRAAQAESRLEEYEAQLEQYQDQLGELKTTLEEREFAGIEDIEGAEKIKSLYRKVSERNQLLDKKEREIKKKESIAMQGLKFQDAMKLSTDMGFGELGLDFQPLMECRTLTDMTIKAAKMVAEKVKTPAVPTEPKPEPAIEPHVDSGVQNAGGPSRVFKASEIEKMSFDERFALKSEISKAMAEGRIDQNK